MAVKVRLARMGAKKKPIYRIVATDGRSPRDGRFIEDIGRYDPNQDPPLIKIKQDRLDHWVGNGAQVSTTVSQLVKKAAKAEG